MILPSVISLTVLLRQILYALFFINESLKLIRRDLFFIFFSTVLLIGGEI